MRKKENLEMKKITKILSVLLMVTLIAVALTACSGGGGVAGKTFKFDSCSIGDTDMTGAFSIMIKEWTFQFKNDGKCVMNMVPSDLAEGTASQQLEGTYEQDGNTVKTKFEGDSKNSLEFTIEGGKLVAEQDGTKIVFVIK